MGSVAPAPRMSQDPEAAARSARWVAASGSALLWRSWEAGEYVVFSPASGDTHLINEVTAKVLRLLERSELGFPDLVRELAISLGADVDERLETHLAGLLVYLDEIGLVESAP